MSEEAPQASPKESERVESYPKAREMAYAEKPYRDLAVHERKLAKANLERGETETAKQRLEIAAGYDTAAERDGEMAGRKYDALHSKVVKAAQKVVGDESADPEGIAHEDSDDVE